MRHLSRRDMLKAAAASAVTLPTLAAAPAPASRRPNILFILSDDQRADTIAALGNARIRTPNLDRLAARGVTFTRAHIMGGLNAAICAPSRAMILTGRTLFRCPEQPKADTPMWPEVLRSAGYATAGIGKWHNGPPAYARCFSAGGPVFFGGMSDQTRISVADFDAEGKYPPAARKVVQRHAAELFADAGVRFLESRKGDEQPFALWLAFTNPHDPRHPPEAYARMYDPKAMALPPNFLPQHPFDNGEMQVRDEKLLPVPRDPDAVRKDLAEYYAAITHMDAQVGRVLDALAASGHADDTIVVFASDNGLAVGSHGLLGKQNLYEHSVRVPLIVSGPGLPRGARSDAMLYLLDLFPTLFELIGLEPPKTVEGRSFAAALRDPGAAGHRDALFFAYRNFQRAVTDGRWKLIRYTVGGTTTTQLFDLQLDPHETRDLSREEAHAAILTRMEKLLADERGRHEP